MMCVTERYAHILGRSLDRRAYDRLATFAALLTEASSRLNLTAVRDPDSVQRRHLLESLALARLLTESGVIGEDTRIVDIGSGGGVPGIPLAVACPLLSVTLLEATGKKATFLQETVSALGLSRVDVLAARAEDAGHDPARRERYDVAVARAVASLDVLAELALPFVRVGGWLAAVKGSRAREEIATAGAALARCGGSQERLLPLPSGDDSPLSVVLVRKVRPTPTELPRRAGMPAKRPIR